MFENKVTDVKEEDVRSEYEKKESLQRMRAEHKIKVKEQKLQEKRALQSKRDVRWFNFFTKWFFIGLVLILTSICISISVDSAEIFLQRNILKRMLMILAGMLSTIGTALLIGAIFDFSKNSEAFVQFVSNILSDIVVSKTFLTTLSQNDKEQALALILKPSDKQVERYSNINAFFTKRINELTTMFDTNFKTNVILDIKAYKDENTKKVYCRTTLTQTIYKIRDTFEPIQVMFEKEGSESLDVFILPPTGESIKMDGKKTESENGGIRYDTYTYEIPKECEKYDHLTIKRTMIEPGHDHWINYYWQSLSPYEGVVCTIDCADGLKIKDYMIFDNKAYYHVVKRKTRLEISSSQWLDTDTGFIVTISETEEA